MAKLVTRHQDLEVYKKAFDLAMRLFELSKEFPKEETYSLTDQIRRSSRSACANLAEAWRKRRYESAFVASSRIAKVRQRKPKLRSSSRFGAAIWTNRGEGTFFTLR